MNKYITVAFGGLKRIRTQALHQYDTGTGIKITGLSLPETYEVQFSNYEVESTAITMIGDENGVDIPNELLETGYTIYAWIYLHATTGNGMTKYTMEIPVVKRAKPEEYEPSGVSPWEDVVRTLTDLAQATEKSATKAESYAVGGTGSRTGEDFDNAKKYAELAKQAATEKGFVYFEIEEPGVVIMYRTDNLKDDLNFEITGDGELEVIFA